MRDTATVSFAVTVAELSALAGAYSGYRAGRRQTSDQAIANTACGYEGNASTPTWRS